jgi:putative oxidoreductase
MITMIRTTCDRATGHLSKLAWLGPLAVRLALGLVFVTSGWGKLHGLDDVTQYFESLGIPAAHAQAVFVSLVELVGGAMILVGLGTRVAAMLLIGVMTVAIWTAKLPEIHGLVELAGTVEVAYLVAFVWLVVAGAGAASLDRVLVRRCACD